MTARTVFMGSPALVVPILESVARESDLVAVVTQPDRPAGRGRRPTPPAVKRAAEALGFEVVQPHDVRDGTFESWLRDLAVDLAVVAAYGRILPQGVLDAPAGGCLNVHFSLLPRWRGAAPIQRAILAGDATTGVSIMRMDAGLDTGPVLDRAEVEIGEHETAGELGARLAALGAERIGEILRRHPDLPAPVPQDDGAATYAPRIDAREGWLRFTEPAAAVVRRVRAMTPWPGAYAVADGKRFKLAGAAVLEDAADRASAPGTIVGPMADRLAVVAGDGRIVGFSSVQPEGRKAISAAACWAGYGRRLAGRRFEGPPPEEDGANG
ncbi:MAG: methionyl-tRNA formyltransferase [Deltaproteobacteria bacterium]|nr:MAG: methionyl-tRNA formyltransferase [Deltaproteobacteria bacterium]